MAKFADRNGITRLLTKIKALLAGKQDTLVSGTNIKTVNNESLLGSGNITVGGTATNGLPSGGTAEQVLSKRSSADYDAEWLNVGTAWHRGWNENLTDEGACYCNENGDAVIGGKLPAEYNMLSQMLELNPITSASDDTVDYWNSKPAGIYGFNQTGCLYGQPNQWGALINIPLQSGLGNAQLWMSLPAGSVYKRSGNTQNSPYSSTNTWQLNIAHGLRDAGNGTEITAQYSGSGLSSASWLCAWDGYKISAISADNIGKASTTATRNTTYTSSGTIYLYKRGGMVCCKLSALAMKTFSSRAQIGTIPAGYRPPAEWHGVAAGYGGYILAETDGRLMADTSYSGKTIYMSFEWPVA